MNTTPIDRVRIFNRERFQVAEFRASVQRSWTLNGEGRAQFTYPNRKSDVVNESVLNYGNYLLVENSSLPAWVGVIDTPRSWTADNVTVSAYTPERILQYRIGELNKTVTAPAGAIFEYIINRVNLAESTAFEVGAIYRGGISRQETFNPKPLSDSLRRIQERSKEDYLFFPRIESDGRLTIVAEWYQKAGMDFDIALSQGKGGGNIEATNYGLMVEDGEIRNELLGYGAGASWASKPNAKTTDISSIYKYGLRQKAIEYNSVRTVAGLVDNINTEIVKSAHSIKRFGINALNVGDTFRYINIGNSLDLQFENFGFFDGVVGYKGRVRIIGMSYDPTNKNKINVVLEEINE